MSSTPSGPARLRVAHLNPNQPNGFALTADAARRNDIAGDLGLSKLKQLAFSGHINAQGRDDWQLRGTLTAEVVQPCVVTLKPVTSRIHTEVTRQYVRHFPTSDAEEVEMSDDEIMPLEAFIDIEALMIEELILAIPDYPRAPGADLDAPASEDPSTEDRRRPFADLGKLLANKSPE